MLAPSEAQNYHMHAMSEVLNPLLETNYLSDQQVECTAQTLLIDPAFRASANPNTIRKHMPPERRADTSRFLHAVTGLLTCTVVSIVMIDGNGRSATHIGAETCRIRAALEQQITDRRDEEMRHLLSGRPSDVDYRWSPIGMNMSFPTIDGQSHHTAERIAAVPFDNELVLVETQHNKWIRVLSSLIRSCPNMQQLEKPVITNDGTIFHGDEGGVFFRAVKDTYYAAPIEPPHELAGL